jgi:hypothetical protein
LFLGGKSFIFVSSLIWRKTNMIDRYRRVYEASLRVLSFFTASAADFAGIAIVQTYLAALLENSNLLSQLSVNKVTMTSASRNAVVSKGDKRDLLRDAMLNIVEMWRSMADEFGGSTNKFRMPYGGSDEILIATARSFLSEALPLREDFTKRGMRNDFLERLQNLTESFEQTANESEDAKRERIGTNAAFTEPAKICQKMLDKLNPIAKQIYRENPQKLAEWLVASHIQRPSQKTSKKTPEPPATPIING